MFTYCKYILSHRRRLAALWLRSRGASHFEKSITKSNEIAKVLVPLKRANIQNRDAPRSRGFLDTFVLGYRVVVAVEFRIY